MRTQMKSAPMILARSLGWLRSYKIRIAVVSTILVVAALKLRTRFLDSYCESITEGISSVVSALSATVGRELERIFGTPERYRSTEMDSHLANVRAWT